MNYKVLEGWTIRGSIRSILVLSVFFLFASGAFATSSGVIQEMIDNASPGDVIQVPSDTYIGSIVVNQSITLEGIGNPVLIPEIVNASPSLVNASPVIDVTGPDGAGSTITGFNITGSGTAVLVEGPEATNINLVYNNIYRNVLGLNASNFGTCQPDERPYTMNFWGENGTGPQRGNAGASTIVSSQSIAKANKKPIIKVKEKTIRKVNGVSSFNAKTKANSKVGSVVYKTNNGIQGYADDSTWLTAGVIDGKVVNALYDDCPMDEIVLDNPDAGVNVSIFGTIESSCILGSAAYLGTPYGPIPTGLGTAIKYVDVFVKGDNVDEARVNISYADVSNDGVFEDTLTPYLWTGAAWKQASKVTRDPVNKVVSGNFSTLSLTGQPIALIGKTYEVTILPPAPSAPISVKPELNITIDSADTIESVYYQLDGHASGGWKLIEDNIGSNIWQNTSWTVSDEDWAKITNGTHVFYFSFTRDSLPGVGGDGEIAWRFTKGGSQPVSTIVVTSPKAGDVLTRTPWKITWTMPSPENVVSVDLWFAKDGDFTMRGGLNNPLHLATLGADTSYLWTSPNFQSDNAKIAVVVIYNDGTQFVGYSDDFGLAKGYSFYASKPTAKLPWELGSDISKVVTVLGSWFHKPHIPYIIG